MALEVGSAISFHSTEKGKVVLAIQGDTHRGWMSGPEFEPVPVRRKV